MRLKSVIIYLLVSLLLGPSAYAFDASSTAFKSDLVTILSAAGTSSSTTYILTMSAQGESAVSLSTLSSATYITDAGQVYLVFVLEEETIIVISNLRAKTATLGQDILEATWQKDDDPYFYWNIDVDPPDILAGFSVSLDIPPDNVIDTTADFYQFPEHSIASGKHTFFVLPFMAGLGPVPDEQSLLSFNLWVDTEPPIIGGLSPQPDITTTNNLIPISCNLSDAHSGVNAGSTVLTINRDLADPTYNPETQVLEYQPDSPLSEGKNTVLLKAYDVAGNYATKGWDFIVDTLPPTGSILLNNGEELTHSAYVNINVQAEDETSGVQYLYLSNDGVFDTELNEPYVYTPLITDWLLREPDVDGAKTVYIKFRDYAGNLSETYQDSITLKLLGPETRIISGPSAITEEKTADFVFESSKPESKFSYKLDNADWSEWSTSTEAHFSGLTEDNHYFYVKSAYDLNGNGQIEADEEDLTPAQWVWTVKPVGYLDKLQRRILFWRR